MDPAKALKETLLFRELPDMVTILASQLVEARVADQGETIVTEGEKSDAMFVIRSGSVRIFKHQSGADEGVVTLGTGSYFGESSLIDDAPRSATVVANERTELLVLHGQALRAKLETNHFAGLQFYRAMAKSLARRLRQTTDDLGFARHMVKERTRG